LKIDFRPIILAGGSGTRFWPRSRKARAKQVLSLDGERTMIQRTVDRLEPLAQPDKVWVITNDLLSGAICGQLDCVPENQVICEPAARNTAPAAGLAAFLLERIAPGAVLGMFPADHTISDEPAFLAVIEQAMAIAAAYGTSDFTRVFAELYPKCENISVDYAILEPRSAKGEHQSNLYCLPAKFGWNDLGSWAALYEHKLGSRSGSDDHSNVTDSAGCLAVEAHRNYVYSPQKFVSLVGVDDLVVVETDDAILITARDRSQDVGKLVKMLHEAGRKDLV